LPKRRSVRLRGVITGVLVHRTVAEARFIADAVGGSFQVPHGDTVLFCVLDLAAGTVTDVAVHVEHEDLVGQIDLPLVQLIELYLLFGCAADVLAVDLANSPWCIATGRGVHVEAYAEHDVPGYGFLVVGTLERLVEPCRAAQTHDARHRFS
jgi:hypothetical protein